MTTNVTKTTESLSAAVDGNAEATQQLMVTVYDELRRLAASYLKRESPDHVLRPTALVHEAFLKLIDQRQVDWQGRTHFFAIAAQSMRRVLVDHARSRKRQKRGGDRTRVTLDEQLIIHRDRLEDVLAMDELLGQLAEMDARQATIIELRFFGGMTVEEVANVLGISKRTVEREWTMARAWLRQQLEENLSS